MNKPEAKVLVKALLAIKSEDECQAFLADLFSAKELNSLETRVKIALGLSQEKKYTEITLDTGASTATISKIKESFTYGQDGLKKIIDRIGDGR